MIDVVDLTPRVASIARPKNGRGFSLIEVMAASTILLVGLGGLIAGATTAFRAIDAMEGVGEATAIATSILEEFELNSPAFPSLLDVNAGNNSGNDPWDDDESNCDHPDNGACAGSALVRRNALNQVAANGKYIVWWDVIDDWPQPGLRTVIVHVKWRSGNGNGTQHEYVSKIIRN